MTALLALALIIDVALIVIVLRWRALSRRQYDLIDRQAALIADLQGRSTQEQRDFLFGKPPEGDESTSAKHVHVIPVPLGATAEDAWAEITTVGHLVFPPATDAECKWAAIDCDGTECAGVDLRLES